MPSIKLPSHAVARLAELQSAKPGLVAGRKNLGLIVAAVNHLYHNLKKTQITSREVEEIVLALGWDSEWDRNPGRKDNDGLAKTIGDCLGDHPNALRLKKVRSAGGFVRQIPKGGITDAHLESIGIDPETCRHRLVVVG